MDLRNRRYGRFYSRQMGWPGGTIVKSFRSEKIYLSLSFDVSLVEGKSGDEILKLNLPEFSTMSRTIKRLYLNWYFYFGDIEITSNLSI